MKTLIFAPNSLIPTYYYNYIYVCGICLCIQAGLLGKNACGSGYDYDLYLHKGAGKFIV